MSTPWPHRTESLHHPGHGDDLRRVQRPGAAHARAHGRRSVGQRQPHDRRRHRRLRSVGHLARARWWTPSAPPATARSCRCPTNRARHCSTPRMPPGRGVRARRSCGEPGGRRRGDVSLAAHGVAQPRPRSADAPWPRSPCWCAGLPRGRTVAPLESCARPLLTLPVVGWAGRHFYTRAWAAFRHHGADMNTLIAVGTGAAFLFSAVVTLFDDWFAARGVEPHVYYEAVALDHRAGAAGQPARGPGQGPDLRRHPPAHRPPPGHAPACSATAREHEVPLAALRAGDEVVVRPGRDRPRRRRRSRRRAATWTSRCSPASRCRCQATGRPRRSAPRSTGTARFRFRVERVGGDTRALADHPPGAAGAGQQGADPAAGRPRSRRCSCRSCSRSRSSTFVRLVRPRPRRRPTCTRWCPP